MTPFKNNDHIKAIQQLDIKEQQGISKLSLKDDYIDANNLNVDLDAPLYRIMGINRLWDLLENKHFCMVHPQVWDDPYEVFLMRSYGVTSQGQGVGFEPITNTLYGLCFSLKKECDGLWRSFSANSCRDCSFCNWYHKHGQSPVTVKIKTTGRKLMDAFYDVSNQFHTLSYWIGKVEYLDSVQISRIVNNGRSFVTDNTGVGLIKSLLVKRKPFEYEQEVRLLYYMSNLPPASQLNTPELYFFDVDPNKLIDDIEFSPWVCEDEVNKQTTRIVKHYNGIVSRSSLYDEPGIHIIV